ncbi:MAG: 3-oxoacyl-ACP reductase [Rhizobiales bacterium NRL2]|jgi:NAD(P)-dependent dehydrogenase (short-subunit alcohol dehydrogenase family)|nr:MAG: 3-oxoacyl-ACP reductase [Rhizobiales bacterium NRL2]
MSENRVALVTGAGSGVGQAAAVALSKAGYDLVISGRRAEKLDETAAATGAGDERILKHQCDVGDPEAVRLMFDACVDRFGRLDVLFNNAGTGAPPVPLDELTPEQWLTVVNANFNGVFYCTQNAFRVMKSQTPMGGRIINNGSISAHAPRPFSAPYTATKHAVTGLTKSTSLDGREFDIACSQIDIGNAATPMTARMPEGVPQPDGSVRAEPVMDVQHVADAVVYMANLPLDANVLFMTVMATKMPFVGRG